MSYQSGVNGDVRAKLAPWRDNQGKQTLTIAGRTFRHISGHLPPFFARPFGQPVAIFFHGVEREIVDPRLQENHHAAADFRAIAKTLKAEFDVAPLTELNDALAHPNRHRRTVFLMSDDGYANTLHTAADILKELEIPWTLFVSTQHIDTGERNPMFLARLFLRHAPDGIYHMPYLSGALYLNGSRESSASEFLRRFRAMPAAQAKQALSEMIAALPNETINSMLARYRSDAFLDWNGVRSLASRGVTIGAHADWHWALHAGEHPDTLRLQVEKPKQRIEAEVGAPCRTFAYPFGNKNDVSAAAWRAVRDAGYEHGFTTMSGTLSASRNRWLLPRYGLALQEPNLPAKVPLLRLANRRLTNWQASLN